MIVGNGLLAKSFIHYKDDDGILIFASGVSNSTNPTKVDCLREQKLLENTIKMNMDKTIIYFSSCDIANDKLNKNPYYIHKNNMEVLVKSQSKNYYIFRLPQVIGKGGNKNTLMNFLVNSIKNRSEFTLYKQTFKSIIDITDVIKMCDYILDNNLYKSQIINIVNPNYISVESIVKEIETFLKIAANYNAKLVVNNPNYDVNISKEISKEILIDFDVNYLSKILFKYYNE